MLDILIIFFGLGIYPLLIGFFGYAVAAIWLWSALHAWVALKFFLTMCLFGFVGKFFSNLDDKLNDD